MEISFNEGITLLVGAIYIICGIILIKYGKRHKGVKHFSVALAAASSLLLLAK